MRRILAFEHLSLDGVIQAPGAPDEDPSGGFALGGWIRPYSDPVLGTFLREHMGGAFDLLLGRKTFEIWARYWPEHGEAWPLVNRVRKYVASGTLTSHPWQPSEFLGGDCAARVAEIKRGEGPELRLWGSGAFAQTLFDHDLIDALWLIIYPVTLGRGKRLFAGGAIPAAFRLAESRVTTKSVIIAGYERSGPLPPFAD